MLRETAYQILTRYLTNPQLLKHCLATEAAMRSLAIRCGGNTEDWAITGLLHDADYDKTKGHPELHGKQLFKYEANSIPSNIQHAIEAHNSDYADVKPNTTLDWALLCCDDLTILIMILMQKQKDKKLASLTTDMVCEKVKDKKFEKHLPREHIFLSEQKLGIPLPEFVGIVLKAMQGIHEILEETPVETKQQIAIQNPA
jgi:predicted hydrolase (HD superfamily)